MPTSDTHAFPSQNQLNEHPQPFNQVEIENRIFAFRQKLVMVDRDLAELFGTKTNKLNEQVKRNILRFPETFRFQLTNLESAELVANCDRFTSLKHASSNPYVFTEQGIAMLSAILSSDIAIKISIQLMNAFVYMRNQLNRTQMIDLRIDNLVHMQLETDQKFETIFRAIEKYAGIPEQGVFFEGQLFDAYTLVADIIRTATKSILLFDNYVDDTVLTLLTKRLKDVDVTIYTQKIDKKLALDLEKHNNQYAKISIKIIPNMHDRFLLIDEKELYHVGASFKDLGKKWFAFSKMNEFVEVILKRI